MFWRAESSYFVAVSLLKISTWVFVTIPCRIPPVKFDRNFKEFSIATGRIWIFSGNIPCGCICKTTYPTHRYMTTCIFDADLSVRVSVKTCKTCNTISHYYTSRFWRRIQLTFRKGARCRVFQHHIRKESRDPGHFKTSKIIKIDTIAFEKGVNKDFIFSVF